MAYNHFVAQLKALGYQVTEYGGNRVSFPYTIASSRLAGKQIRVGFEVPLDFPLNPPPGPHVSPRILPLNDTQRVNHPNGGIHQSAGFGDEWEYWSRPMHHWAQTKRTVRDVIAHLNRLMDTL